MNIVIMITNCPGMTSAVDCGGKELNQKDNLRMIPTPKAILTAR